MVYPAFRGISSWGMCSSYDPAYGILRPCCIQYAHAITHSATVFIYFFFSLGQSRSTSRIQYSMYVKEEAASPINHTPSHSHSCLGLPFFFCRNQLIRVRDQRQECASAVRFYGRTRAHDSTHETAQQRTSGQRRGVVAHRRSHQGPVRRFDVI